MTKMGGLWKYLQTIPSSHIPRGKKQQNFGSDSSTEAA